MELPLTKESFHKVCDTLSKLRPDLVHELVLLKSNEKIYDNLFTPRKFAYKKYMSPGMHLAN